MSDKFVEKYTVGEDLVKSLNKKDATSQILYDLIGRKSNCDYTQQIVDGLLENEELVGKLTELMKPTIEKDIKLPAAWRVYLNSDALGKHSTEIIVAFEQEQILARSSMRDLVTSKINTESNDYTRVSDTVINNTSISYEIDRVLTTYDFTVSVFDGVNKPGPTHPAPVWSEPPSDLFTDKANMVQIDLELVIFSASGSRDEIGTNILSRSYISRLLMHPQDIIEQKMMRMTGSLLNDPGIDGKSKYTRLVVTARFIGSSFSYNGVPPKIGFFKQNEASEIDDEVEPDTSNFIDVITLGITQH